MYSSIFANCVIVTNGSMLAPFVVEAGAPALDPAGEPSGRIILTEYVPGWCDDRAPLHVDLVELRRPLHDELEARRDVAAHQGLDRLLGLAGVVDRDPQQRPRLRIERRLLE